MTKRRSRAVIAAAILALALGGCSASAPETPGAPSSPSSPSDSGDAGLTEAYPEGPTDGAGQPEPFSPGTNLSDIDLPEVTARPPVLPVAPPGATAAPPDGAVGQPATPPVASQDRAIVRSASMALTVGSVQSAVAGAAQIALDLGGTVDSQTLSNDGAAAEYADLTLRVPADTLDRALTELADLGDLRSETRSSNDVTEASVDLEARVSALSASITRLTELMEGAATTSDLIEAESALAQRQQELDGLTAQLESLRGQVEMASVWVSLSERSALPGGGPQSFWGAILAGVGSIGTFFSGAFIALGFALPWLILLALVGLAIVLPIRARKRRARAAALTQNSQGTQAADSVVNQGDL